MDWPSCPARTRARPGREPRDLAPARPPTAFSPIRKAPHPTLFRSLERLGRQVFAEWIGRPVQLEPELARVESRGIWRQRGRPLHARVQPHRAAPDVRIGGRQLSAQMVGPDLLDFHDWGFVALRPSPAARRPPLVLAYGAGHSIMARAPTQACQTRRWRTPPG